MGLGSKGADEEECDDSDGEDGGTTAMWMRRQGRKGGAERGGKRWRGGLGVSGWVEGHVRGGEEGGGQEEAW